VASRATSQGVAWAWLLVLCLIGLVVLLQLRWQAQLVALSSLAPVAAYPFMKRITWWPQAWLGLTFNWGALLGFAAATGASTAVAAWTFATQGFALWDVGRLTLPALALYASGIFWTLGYDTIYAIQDLEDDALAGVKSSARRLGDKAPRAVTFFYLMTIALAFIAGLGAHLGLAFEVALIAFAVHLGLQARKVRTDDPALALRLFRSNTWAGLILVVALALGVLP
jgi:4-hydroxybenzoate polyprenyltransferase